MSRFVPLVAGALIAGMFSSPGSAQAKDPLKLAGHGRAVTALACSADGEWLASAGEDDKVRIWAVATGEEKAAISSGRVFALAFSPDGNLLAAAGGRDVNLYEPAKGKQVGRLQGHEAEVTAVAFSPDGLTLASGGYDKTIRLWRLTQGKETEWKELRRFKIPNGRVTALAFSPDGKLLASGGTAAMVHVGRNIIGTGEAARVRLWDVIGQAKVRELPIQGSRLAFSPDGKYVVAGGHVTDIRSTRRGTTYNGIDRIAVVETATGRPVKEMTLRGVEVAFGKGNALATAAGSDFGHLHDFGSMGNSGINSYRWDGRARLWDLAKDEEVLRLPLEDVNVLTFLPDGKVLATGAKSGEILLWNIENERRNPTPDPKEIVKVPPAEDKLLNQLHADYQSLLKKEKDPAPLRRAAILFHQHNPADALAILRQQRALAGIPLLLRYLVEDAENLKSPGWWRPYSIDSFVVLTGKQWISRSTHGRKVIRDAVADLVQTWWLPNKEKISLDLDKMSPEQWAIIARQLLAANRGRDSSHRDPFSEIWDRLLAALEPEDDGWQTWWEQDLHAGMIRFLLAPTGYQEKPSPRARETSPMVLRAVPLLGALRKGGQAQDLHKIADDARQSSATRLTCLLALHKAGEPLPTNTLLALLKHEKKLERRMVGVLALQYGQAGMAAPALLKFLDDPNRHVRAAAVEALRTFKPPEALRRLGKLLDRGLPRRDDTVSAVLTLIAEIGTKEGQGLLAGFLQRTINEPGMGVHLWDALEAFEAATGRRWLNADDRTDARRRDAAQRAAAWWIKQNPS